MKSLLGTLPHDMADPILEGLDSNLLLTDLLTDEIIYASPEMNRSYNVDCDPTGKRCWEVYHDGMEQRCSFCPLPEIMLKAPKNPILWEEPNQRTGKWFRNTSRILDWPGGRKVHMLQSVDITELKERSNALQRELAQQALMSDISQSFISFSDTRALIGDALRKMGDFLEVDRISLGKLVSDMSEVLVVQSWHRKPEFAMPAKVDTIPVSKQLLVQNFMQEDMPYIHCKDVSKSPEFSALQAIGLTCFLWFPVVVDGKLWGILSIALCTEIRPAPESVTTLGYMVRNVISALILRDEYYMTAKEAEKRTALMLNTTPIASIFLDADGTPIDCNEEALKMYGVPTKEEFTGSYASFMQYSPQTQPDGMPSEEKALEKIKSAYKNGREKFEWLHITNNGELLPAEILLERVDWQGSHRVIGYVTDLREIKATMEKLDEARVAAEASARAKTTFLANMSHEIRTPLNGIMGMAAIAKGSQDTEQMHQCLERIDTSAGHLLSIINDVLDMSKIEAGKMELSHQAFSLARFAADIKDIFAYQTAKKNLAFTVWVDENAPGEIIADRQRLMQVLTNLLSNAVKFTPEQGAVSLSITNFGQANGGATLYFEVKDSGIGIREAEIGHLFDAFYQADGGTARRYGGTGLGLTISQTIVELMGGSIQVISSAGKGARFFFIITVPVSRAAPSPAEDAAHMANYAGIFGGRRFLMAEDIDLNREVMLAMLEETGAEIDCAGDGRAAVEMFSKNPNRYDLILMDINMPELDGYQAAREIRQSRCSRSKTVPIIAMTANVFKEDIEKCLAAGMNDHIGKPVDMGEVISAILHALPAQP